MGAQAARRFPTVQVEKRWSPDPGQNFVDLSLVDHPCFKMKANTLDGGTKQCQ